ncbi:thermonuclease family protein [Desulfurivibrio sp. D14AmB]|uniref:thermonuclease family protein n=1 Tax=Desulfurivibrio sp. D14AmB TaxID=3374370 RepID=UPI00376F0C4D
MKIAGLLLVCCLLLVASVHAATWPARVTNISDGDTIRVITPDGKQERIRFYGIDAPESGQPYGKAATQFVESAIAAAGYKVDIVEVERDRYGRIVGMVIVDGVNLNREVVKAGFAWVYGQYCKKPECREWKALENKARDGKLGLWGEPGPVPPWDWRRGEREGRVLEPAAESRSGVESQARPGDCLIKGNINSKGEKIYHVPGGRHYERTRIDKSRGQRWFCSEEEARAAGWRRSRQ